MDKHHSDILIIGAGMAGLASATRLQAAGLSVTVLDKGRGPGGRMAARRAEIAGQTAAFDHGAQFFTARDAGFAAAVSEWEQLGVVTKWPAASSASGDEAWVGIPGMNGPIRAMAQELNVHWGTRAEKITREGAVWNVSTEKGDFAASTLLVAVPAEQAGVLLNDVAPSLAAIPGAVVSEPCWAVMAGFEQPLDFADDTVRQPGGAIAWAARNSAKPLRTGTECWVLHASPKRSREIIDLPKEEAGPLLLDDFFKQTGVHPAKPIHLAAHRWLYAMPAAVSGEPARFDAEARIGIAGDYLHSPRVEGAWISGATLSDKVLSAPR